MPSSPRPCRILAWGYLLLAATVCIPPAVCQAAPATQSPPPLVLQGLGRAALPLDGTWQFHEGDEPTWASPALDDSRWEPIQVGRPWEGQGHYGYTGFAWYRRHLMLPAGEPKDWNLALFLPTVDSAAEIYWNGVLVGSAGKLPPHPVWFFTYNQPTQAFQLGPARSGVLAIRVWKAPIVFLSYPDEGGLLKTPQVGSAEAIAGLQTTAKYEWLRQYQFTLAVVLLLSVAGALSLLMWSRHRQRTILLWLALAMVYPLEQLLLVVVPGFVSFRVFYGLIGTAVSLNDMALWFLLLAFLGLSGRRTLVRWTKIVITMEIALDLVDGLSELFNLPLAHPRQFLIADIATTIPAVTLELWGLVIVFSAFRQRLDAARWTLAIAALLADLWQFLADTGTLGLRWTHWTLWDRIGGPLFTIGGSGLAIDNITNTLLLVSILYVAWRYSIEAGQRQIALEQEYRSAQELQQVLIPEALPVIPGYEVTSAYRPAEEVGGDFFQLIPQPDKSALLVIGDVSGKGLPAAMAVALIVGAIRSTAETTDNPTAILAALNRRLHGRLRGGFATCLVLRLDADGAFTIANAGHLPPFFNGEELELPPALPLGLLPEAEYEPARFRVAKGDRLSLYTDGLLEARDTTGALFGFARVAALLATARDAQAIADAAQQFGQDDDITVLTLARTA